MSIFEAAFFYGDFSILRAECQEMQTENVSAIHIHATNFDLESSTKSAYNNFNAEEDVKF